MTNHLPDPAKSRTSPDLKSTKRLLDDAEDLSGENEVPLLNDLLEDSVNADEGMADDTFKALLDDAWQDSVEGIFRDARTRLEHNRASWLPQDTEDLAQILKIRIDASVRTWLAETLEANIGRLRERIVSELSAEILAHMYGKFNPSSTPKDPDIDHG